MSARFSDEKAGLRLSIRVTATVCGRKAIIRIQHFRLAEYCGPTVISCIRLAGTFGVTVRSREYLPQILGGLVSLRPSPLFTDHVPGSLHCVTKVSTDLRHMGNTILRESAGLISCIAWRRSSLQHRPSEKPFAT